MEAIPPPEYPSQPVQRQVALQVPRRTPWVTYTLLAVTIGIFAIQLFSESSLGVDLPALYGMKINAAILEGEYWRLITPALLHGSILHVGLNMYALYAIGASLERQYGPGRYLALYLLSAYAGNILSFIFSPNPSLGSSTAIFGLFAAEGMLIYQNRRLLGGHFRSLIMNILMIAGVNLVIGLSPGIDNWGHMGGLLGGVLFAGLAGPHWEVQGTYPSLQLEDTRSPSRVWISALLVFFLLSALVFSVILQRT